MHKKRLKVCQGVYRIETEKKLFFRLPFHKTNEGCALDASWMNNEHCKVDKNKVSDNTFGGKQLAEDE